MFHIFAKERSRHSILQGIDNMRSSICPLAHPHWLAILIYYSIKKYMTLRQLHTNITDQNEQNSSCQASRIDAYRDHPPPRVNRIGVCIAPKLAAKSDSIDIRHRQCLIITLWLRFSVVGSTQAINAVARRLVLRRVKARQEDEPSPTRTSARQNY